MEYIDRRRSLPCDQGRRWLSFETLAPSPSWGLRHMRTQSAIRLVFLPAALLLSLASIPSDRAPHALRTSDAYAAVDPKADKNYDLASLETLRKSIVQIKDNYVDPSRINPKEMFTSGLEAVERQVAEVMVEFCGQGCAVQGAKKVPVIAAWGAAESSQADTHLHACTL